jgi:hypothetical protein
MSRVKANDTELDSQQAGTRRQFEQDLAAKP